MSPHLRHPAPVPPSGAAPAGTASANAADALGTEPVGKMLWRLTLPAIVASTVQAIYNIVDRLYIGRSVGTDAMAGLSLTFPYMMVLAAFGVLVGAGSAAVLSIRLGQGRKDEAEKILGQLVALKLLFFFTIPVVAYLLLDQTLAFFGGTPQAIPYAHSYLSVILIGNVFSHLAFGMSSLMRAEGNARRAMTAMLIGAGSNIVLDPVFIYGWLGLPAMGLKGAAWATNAAMACSAAYAFWHFRSDSCVVKLRLSRIRIYSSLVGPVFAIGLSPCVHAFVMSVIQIAYNKSFVHWASDMVEANLYIAAAGIINSVIHFGIQPAFGLMQGVQPLIGYNYGARKPRRMLKAFKLAMGWSTLACCLCTLTVWTFADPLAGVFTKDPALHRTIAWGLRILSAGLPTIGGPFISGTYFQSVGRASMSLLLSSMRQVLMLLPLILAMPFLFGVKGIWYAPPTSDVLSSAVIMLVVWHELRRVVRSPAYLADTSLPA